MVRRMKRTVLLVATLGLHACSNVQWAYTRDDYATRDQKTVKRLVLALQPLPEGNARAGSVFARVARRFVNMKREFLVRKEQVQAETLQFGSLCTDGAEGVLWLEPDLKPEGTGFRGTVEGRLLRCPDAREVWCGKASGFVAAADEGLASVADTYAKEFGDDARRYVAPALNLMRPLLERLPNPILSEEDVTEKMSLDE